MKSQQHQPGTAAAAAEERRDLHAAFGYDQLPRDRRPPYSEEAEHAVLGAVMVDREAVGLARERVTHSDFYRLEHQITFRAMCRLYENDQAIDPITVADMLQKSAEDFLDKRQLQALRDRDLLDLVGGMDFLIDLAGMMGTAANVLFHAGIVREKSVLRHLISVSTGIAGEAYEGRDDVEAILDRAQGRIFEISEQSETEGFSGVERIVPKTFKSIEEAFQNNSDVTGLPTGFKEMDRKTGGLQKADLVILAARPSMGKTSLALNLAYHVAVNEGKSVGIFSLEMSREQLVMRMLGSSAGFNLHNLRRGKLRAEDWPRLTAACEQLSKAPIFIDDNSGISVLEMKAKARRLKQQHGLDMVIIDYLQLMSSPGRQENRQQEISNISRNLKGMAKDLNVPVLALSQLSRGVEARTEHRPMLSDLRESGAIEQDADLVLFIFREEVYKPDDESVRNMAKIIIGKQRNGPIGEFDLHFHKEFTRFADLAR
ncbi:replicative DNA helicase [bacterium CG_4_9_14_3_um_filter_65_15]|nr:MAG: replicative DNA helicase [bacterium CG_4_9_14_3_um_filter_65_15]